MLESIANDRYVGSNQGFSCIGRYPWLAHTSAIISANCHIGAHGTK